jgi:LacI family transcriptional regulator
MSKRATLADVAARAGMSTAAASMVLNNRPGSRLSVESAERIRAAAAELGYRPNQTARSLRLGTTRTVAFLSDDVTTTRYASGMIRGLLEVAAAHEHTVLIAETASAPERVERALEAMLDREPDAVIFGVMAAREVHVPRIRADLPVILVNSSSATKQHPTVLPAEYVAGRQIAEQLADAGHTDIAILGYVPEHAENPGRSLNVGSRFAGIKSTIIERGLRVVARFNHQHWEPETGFEGMNQLLDCGARFTGVICLNDRLAFGAYQAMQLRGVRVPEDVSVVSFDDDVVASYVRPGLTTAALPYEEMGRRAMEMALSGTFVGAERVLVPMPLRIRDSVRKLH